MNQKNKDFLNAGDPSSLGKPRPPLSYGTPDGKVVTTPQTKPAAPVTVDTSTGGKPAKKTSEWAD